MRKGFVSLNSNEKPPTGVARKVSQVISVGPAYTRRPCAGRACVLRGRRLSRRSRWSSRVLHQHTEGETASSYPLRAQRTPGSYIEGDGAFGLYCSANYDNANLYKCGPWYIVFRAEPEWPPSVAAPRGRR